MNWDSVNISDKIQWLKSVVMNSTHYVSDDEHILNALITGSTNTFSGDIGFDIQSHHIEFMRKLWDKHIKTQKDNTIIHKMRKRS